jgi:very-short-patch-repair endonuclease
VVLRTRTHIARRLRRNATDVETQLWRALRESFPAHRFRRQHPVGRYVVDFACPARKLAIEIDGGQHASRHPEDAARTDEIARRGYRVIRFWNNEVMGNLRGVLETIERELVTEIEV